MCAIRSLWPAGLSVLAAAWLLAGAAPAGAAALEATAPRSVAPDPGRLVFRTALETPPLPGSAIVGDLDPLASGELFADLTPKSKDPVAPRISQRDLLEDPRGVIRRRTRRAVPVYAATPSSDVTVFDAIWLLGFPLLLPVRRRLAARRLELPEQAEERSKDSMAPM